MENREIKKEDRRVLYTKMFLKEALLELMKEKSVDRITPTELCRKAGINRNTFYSHYYSARELLESIEADLEEQIMLSLATKLPDSTVYDLMCDVCQTIYAQKELCKILLSCHGDVAFLDKVIGLGKETVLSEWRKIGIVLTDDMYDMLFSFVVDGSLSVLRCWAQQDMRHPPQEIARLIEKVSYGGIAAFEKEGERENRA